MSTAPVNADAVRSTVRARYAQIATRGGSCCGSACDGAPEPLGKASASAALGYSTDEMNAVPAGSNLGLGCGNPQALAELRPGEVVLDLGSGGGFDCFLAAAQVGADGRVIGVDMTAEMVSTARANAAQGEYANVEFRLGEIEHLPVADGAVDVILSNCVVNLSPDKPQVYREAFRVLRPGGRLAISDVVALQPLPATVTSNLDAHCGCVAGAALLSDLQQMLGAAGFVDIDIRLKEESREFIKTWFPGSGVEDFVLSADIRACRGHTPRTGIQVGEDGKATATVDARVEELIAIGAAITAHCQPCLTYHVASARSLGLDEVDIRTAVEIGQRVEKGSLAAMRRFADNVVEGQEPTAETPSCCGRGASPTGKTCCS
jgi:AhpD family alkylhydroperoxidase